MTSVRAQLLAAGRLHEPPTPARIGARQSQGYQALDRLGTSPEIWGQSPGTAGERAVNGPVLRDGPHSFARVSRPPRSASPG